MSASSIIKSVGSATLFFSLLHSSSLLSALVSQLRTCPVADLFMSVLEFRPPPGNNHAGGMFWWRFCKTRMVVIVIIRSLRVVCFAGFERLSEKLQISTRQ